MKIQPQTLALIVGMALVTYIPRMLPGIVAGRQMPPWLRRWLQHIPYAALGALIFPGILQGQTPWAGLAGGLIAVLLGLREVPLIVVMVGGILAALGVQLLGGG